MSRLLTNKSIEVFDINTTTIILYYFQNSFMIYKLDLLAYFHIPSHYTNIIFLPQSYDNFF